MAVVVDENEYLREARACHFGTPDYEQVQHAVSQHRNAAALNDYLDRSLYARDRLVARYAWAIPNEAALSMLASYAPLIEIGAGTGYWASLLRERGVDILAYDTQPPTDVAHRNTYHRNAKGVGTCWTEVLRGGTPQAAKHPGRTLFLCWPPYGSPMAYNALRHYTGKTLAYIGEGQGGCTGNDAFHALLEREWEEIDGVSIPQWNGVHDYLTIWQRNEAQ